MEGYEDFMDRHLAESNLQQTDLFVYQCGALYCENGHAYGPAVRDHYLIHYIHSGKGIFKVGDTIYHLSAGSGFLICPDIITYYKADDNNPWHYSWVGFHGKKVESYLKDAGLTQSNPIFTYDQDDFISNCFLEMNSAYYLKRGGEIKRFAYLFLFLHKLVQMNPEGLYYDSADDRRDKYVTMALYYIEMNYMQKITVGSISQHVGLNRSYLGVIFKNALNMSIQEYLTSFRIRKACELLPNEELSIANISRTIGYTDPLLFSKVFKKLKGSSPKEYRNILLKAEL